MTTRPPNSMVKCRGVLSVRVLLSKELVKWCPIEEYVFYNERWKNTMCRICHHGCPENLLWGINTQCRSHKGTSVRLSRGYHLCSHKLPGVLRRQSGCKYVRFHLPNTLERPDAILNGCSVWTCIHRGQSKHSRKHHTWRKSHVTEEITQCNETCDRLSSSTGSAKRTAISRIECKLS